MSKQKYICRDCPDRTCEFTTNKGIGQAWDVGLCPLVAEGQPDIICGWEKLNSRGG